MAATDPTHTPARTLHPDLTDGSGAMFDGLAGRYDLLNRLMTFGSDRRWRRLLVEALDLPPGGTLLDVATGTADVAIAAARACPDTRVIGLDPSAAMLAVGRAKVERLKLGSRIDLRLGKVEALEMGTASVDGVAVAFGLRNFPDRPAALAEMRRVTKPGRRVAVLEVGQPEGPAAPFARLYTEALVPVLGGLLSGWRQYRYLVESARRFPCAATVVQMLTDAGLVDVGHRPVSLGGVFLYWGTAR